MPRTKHHEEETNSSGVDMEKSAAQRSSPATRQRINKDQLFIQGACKIISEGGMLCPHTRGWLGKTKKNLLRSGIHRMSSLEWSRNSAIGRKGMAAGIFMFECATDIDRTILLDSVLHGVPVARFRSRQAAEKAAEGILALLLEKKTGREKTVKGEIIFDGWTFHINDKTGEWWAESPIRTVARQPAAQSRDDQQPRSDDTHGSAEAGRRD